jgi:hypothetical protein
MWMEVAKTLAYYGAVNPGSDVIKPFAAVIY